MRPRSGPSRESIGMLNAYGRFASLGVQLAASMCIFGWGGYWLDGKLDTYPWLMITGLMVGAGMGFYSLILTVNSALPGSKNNATSNEPTHEHEPTSQSTTDDESSR